MIEYRKAQPNEVELIMPLVVNTFNGEQGIPEEMNYLSDGKNPHWFCATEGDKLIGTIAFFQESDGWHAGRFAIEPDYRGKHIGTKLLTFAYQEMFDSGVEVIVMDGRPATVHILTKLGAEVTGQEYRFYNSTCTPLKITRKAFLGAGI